MYFDDIKHSVKNVKKFNMFIVKFIVKFNVSITDKIMYA